MRRDERNASALQGHLDPEELAILAEGRRATPQVVEHLAQCRSCMSAYADVVRYRAATIVFPEAFQDAGPRYAYRSTGGMLARWIPIAASVVVVLGIVLAVGTIRQNGGPHDPVVALLERASGEGLVYPGGEGGAAGTGPSYRAEPVAAQDAEQAIDRLRSEYERAPKRNRAVGRLAAGLLASGRLDLARDYIAEGLADTPQSTELLILSGIAAYRSGEMGQSESLLEAAAARSPGNLTAVLDLGLLLCERRQCERAKSYLEQVRRQSPHSRLGLRAQRALADCVPR